MSSKKDLQLPTVTITELKDLLSHFHKQRKPLYLWGRPSTGKTSAIRQFAQKKAKSLGLEYSEDKFGEDIFTMKVITLSQYDAADLRGMPIIKETEEGSKVTQFIPTEELPRKGQGIIFIDELNLADDTVRPQMYNYVLEGRLSNLPPILDENGKDKFWRVAASNSERDYSGVNRTYLALLSRFHHLQVEPDADEIVRYFLDHEDDPRIIGFIKNNPQDLFPQQWNEKLLDRKANPFPRMWENASHLIKNVKSGKGNWSLLQNLVGSSIGPEVANKFVSYCKLTSKINIDEFMKSPKEHIQRLGGDDNKASLFYAVISALATYWWQKKKKLTPEKVVEIGKDFTDEGHAEFAVAFLKLVLKKREKSLISTSGLTELLDKLGIYFDE